MSNYQVFARKYRPQTFDAVVGQEHITQTLKNAIERNRLAHAYLFVGPRGTGKTSTARILAKALNCEHGPTITPCGECPACLEIAGGNSLDVLEIDGASNNGVEQVRELRDNVRFAPSRGKYKVYIIDEVHMLTSGAFNALLKTLEEPPEHVKFIFATTDVQKVLPTILSRCQRFDLRRIPAELIAGHLGYIAEQEGITLEPGAARAVAKGAEGGLRDAESMLDQLVAFCGERIEEQDVLSVFGFTAAHTVSSLCDALFARDSAGALSVVQQQAQAGRDLSRLMADLIGHLRNVLVAKADPEGIKAEVGEDELAILLDQADQLPLERLLDLIEQFAAAEGRMKWAPNKKLHFEIAVIKAIQTLGQVTLTEVLDTLSAIQSGAPLPAPAERPKPRVPRPQQPPQSAARQQSAPPATPVSKPKPTAKPLENKTPAAPAPAAAAAPLPVKVEPELEEAPAATPTTTLLTPEASEEDDTPPWEEPSTSASPSPKEQPAPPPQEESAPSSASETSDDNLLLGDDLLGGLELSAANSLPVAQPLPVEVEPEPEIALDPPAPVSAAPAPQVEVETEAEEEEPPSFSPPAPVAQDAPEAVEEKEEPLSLDELWLRFLIMVRDKKPLLRPWVEAGVLVSSENGAQTIAFPPGEAFAMESLEKPTTRRLLEGFFATLTGSPATLRFERQANLVVNRVELPEKEVEAEVDPMDAFKNDPLIQKALELFQAELQQN